MDNVSVGAGSTTGTINVGDGADKIALGNGATTGAISLGGGNDTLTAGNGVTTGGLSLSGGGSDSDVVTFGDNATIKGNIDTESDNDDQSITLGIGSRVTGNINTHGGNDTVTIGDTSTIGGFVRVGDDLSLRDADRLTIGDGVSIGGYVETNAGNDVVSIGDDVTVSGTNGIGASVDTYLGNDTVSVGSGFTAPNDIFTGVGADDVTIALGSNADVNGGGGSDAITVVFPLGDRQKVLDALADQGFKPNPDGSYGGQSSFSYGGNVYYNVEKLTAVPCFTRGTMIACPSGPVAVERLRVGDLVLTRDDGPQRVRWIGGRRLDAADLAAAPNLRPVRIRAGALGAGVPAADLVVSPQHRVLVRSAIAQRMFGAREVLVAARQLCQIEGIALCADADEVEYVHIMFDRHQVVISNGAETESLFAGPEALKSVGAAARAEILALFPELAEAECTPIPAARSSPGGWPASWPSGMA